MKPHTAVLLSFVSMASIAVAFGPSVVDARPQKTRPGLPYYSDDFIEKDQIRDLAEEKNYEEVYQFYSYYEASYDEAGRVIVFKEYRRGELIRSDEYHYAPGGSLHERHTSRPGKPVEISRFGKSDENSTPKVDPE
jgi:hypothetical protein